MGPFGANRSPTGVISKLDKSSETALLPRLVLPKSIKKSRLTYPSLHNSGCAENEIMQLVQKKKGEKNLKESAMKKTYSFAELAWSMWG